MTLVELFEELDSLKIITEEQLHVARKTAKRVSEANILCADIVTRLSDVCEAHRNVLDTIKREKERLTGEKFKQLLHDKPDDLIEAIMAVEAK